jgi:hypothetical protein
VGDSFDACPNDRNAFWSMLTKYKDKVRAVFVAHTHHYYKKYVDEIYQVDVGNAGNDYSNVNECHIVRVEITSTQVIFRVLASSTSNLNTWSIKDTWTIDCKPFEGIVLSEPAAQPSTVADSIATLVNFSVKAVPSIVTVSSVTIDLSPLSGASSASMTNSAGAYYTLDYQVPPGLPQGTVQLDIIATDSKGGTANTKIPLKIAGFFSGWQDDFDDNNADGWTVGRGTWSVSNGQYMNSGSGVSWAGESGWDDYTFTADVTPQSGTDVWMIFRVQDADNFYLFTLNGNGALYKYANSTYQKIQNASGTFQDGNTYALKLDVKGSTIKVYSSDVLILEATDNTFTSGYIGFGANGSSGAYDNVRVESNATVITSFQHRPACLPVLSVRPLPMHGSGRIQIMGNAGHDIHLKIFSPAGFLVSQKRLTGNNPVYIWQGKNLKGNRTPSGVYIIKVQSMGFMKTRKFVLIH